jgi:hypothetical protein
MSRSKSKKPSPRLGFLSFIFSKTAVYGAPRRKTICSTTSNIKPRFAHFGAKRGFY